MVSDYRTHTATKELTVFKPLTTEKVGEGYFPSGISPVTSLSGVKTFDVKGETPKAQSSITRNNNTHSNGVAGYCVLCFLCAAIDSVHSL